ncbi:hypothetical protein BSF37_21855 [Serratia marcescens]|uniref:type IV secretion system protein TraC n=1 Tax=Serratia marcescens TaxID=615 RepID=UPI0014803471|nr:type IV secretion system protein TraC [Serratia marcescens]NMM74444.1 hypothetical protein [Serratia marcescens]
MKFDLSGLKFNPLNIIDDVASILGDKETVRQTQRMLDDMDYPHIRDLLPFADYMSEEKLFINKDSVGFVLESQPLIGGNEQVVNSLEALLQESVPRGTPLQVLMVSSGALQEQIDYGLKDFGWTGYRADECNDINRRFALHGARHGFPNGLGHPLTLRDYRLFFTWAHKTRRVTETDLIHVRDVRRAISNALTAADIFTRHASADDIIGVIRELCNHDVSRLASYEKPYDPQSDLTAQMVDNSTSWLVKPGYIRISGSDAKARDFSSRMVSMNLDRNPHEHYLWQNGNIIADLASPTSSIACPFLFSMVLVTDEQMKSQGEAKNRFLGLDSRVNTPYAKFIPGTVRQHAEWKGLVTELDAGRTALTRYFYGLTFFCEDDDEAMSRYVENTKKAFARQAIKMVRADYMQVRNLLATLPFTMADPKLWRDLNRTGATQRAESFHATNLMPVIGDNKLSSAGILLPSYRNQVAFLDVFDEDLPNTNFNWFLSGTSGAGKSVFAQALARQVIDREGYVSITDIGDSYKAFCSSIGGAYINGENLRFNPFANVTDIKLAAERIRDQLCILASPRGLLDEVHESLMMEAITEQWPTYEQGMRIDHVVDYLKKRQGDVALKSGAQIAGRIDEMVTLLNKYTTKGIYGKFFNSDEPTLKMDMRFVVTELGDLRNRGDLLSAVLFTLMIWSENLMYSTQRDLRKMNIIDEGWKLLGGSSDKIRQFIEEGYRTARRHGGSCGTVTQSIRDKNLSTASLAAYENSSFKFTAMQEFQSFSMFEKEEPNAFSEQEWELVKKFPAAKLAKYSALLVKIGGSSSFHRLLLDPLSDKLFSSKGQDFTYREKRLAEGADIKDILFEMVERDAEKRRELEALLAMPL